MTDFNWLESRDTVVVPEQAAIAVYVNTQGDIMIRQDGGWPDEDNIVIVAPLHAVRLADAILVAAGVHPSRQHEAMSPAPPVAAKDPIAAERQRRYRQRHRNGAGRNGAGRDGDDRYGEMTP